MKTIHTFLLVALILALVLHFSEKDWEGPATKSQNY